MSKKMFGFLVFTTARRKFLPNGFVGLKSASAATAGSDKGSVSVVDEATARRNQREEMRQKEKEKQDDEKQKRDEMSRQRTAEADKKQQKDDAETVAVMTSVAKEWFFRIAYGIETNDPMIRQVIVSDMTDSGQTDSAILWRTVPQNFGGKEVRPEYDGERWNVSLSYWMNGKPHVPTSDYWAIGLNNQELWTKISENKEFEGWVLERRNKIRMESAFLFIFPLKSTEIWFYKPSYKNLWGRWL